MHQEPTPRLKDVLFALAAATELGQPLGRLPLQKIIYLADVLSSVWRDVAKPPGFFPYHNGPYDLRIQNTVDSLVFRSFANVSAPKFRRKDQIECQYVLSQAGFAAVERLCAEANLKTDLDLFRQVAKEISRRGWENIKALVYAEPTYDTAKTVMGGRLLRVDSPSLNLSRGFLSGFREALQGPEGESVSPSNLVQLFFAVLERRAEMMEVGAQ